MPRLPRFAILTGPNSAGSTMKALVLATQSGELSAKVALVVAPSYEAPSIQTARSVAVDVAVFIPGSDNYGVALRNELAAQGVDFICLAGYLRLLPKEIIEFFPGKILNIHPALLPAFGGKGMYGKRVHHVVAMALAEGVVSESGCTVHLVNEHYDEGAIVVQSRCHLPPGSSAEKIESLVRDLEGNAYLDAIRILIEKEGLG